LSEKQGDGERFLFFPAGFWVAIDCKSRGLNVADSILLLICTATVRSFRQTIEGIYFPVCHHDHWFMVFVSLKDQQILYADGLSHAPPNNLAEAVLGALRDIFHQDISSWDHRAQRLECPDQGDGHSCGIVVLCEMMYRLTASPNRRYVKSQSQTLRISWLRAILEYSFYVENMNCQPITDGRSPPKRW